MATLSSIITPTNIVTATSTTTMTNKTLTAPVMTAPALGTVASGIISACTSTSMVLVTPVLGTPTSGNLSNCTSTSMALVTPVLGTPTSGNLSNCTADGTDQVGFKNLPQNSQSASYTLVLADAGKHIFHPVADNNARTFTIPAASSVAFPIGTAVTFINMAAAACTIAITTDVMNLSSAGTTGSRTLAQYGSATAIKVAGLSSSGIWLISGSGLT